MSKFNDADDPQRRVLIQALTLGFITAGMPVDMALAESLFGNSPSKLPDGQSMYRLNGSVKVNGKEASINTKVGPKDVIETGAKSEAVFVVGGNAMILRANSQLAMDGAEDNGNFVITGLRMLSGKLLSVSRNQSHRVQTHTATIGIRGTGFYVEADPELTYFCTCYGITDVQATDDPSSKDTVEATHHDKPLYILNKEAEGKNIRRAGFINHEDQELMLIETLVGRSPPFVFSGSEYSAPRREY